MKYKHSLNDSDIGFDPEWIDYQPVKDGIKAAEIKNPTEINHRDEYFPQPGAEFPIKISKENDH